MIRYFDASALAKRYVAERQSRAMGRPLSDGIAVTCRLAESEIATALVRRQREGAMTLAERYCLLEIMPQDIASLYVVEASPEVSALAFRLLMRHKLRAGDALHLASALTLSGRCNLEMQFVGFDQALNQAAAREGLDLPVF